MGEKPKLRVIQGGASDNFFEEPVEKPTRNEKVVPIEQNLPHIVDEVICLHCLSRWIDVRPLGMLLKNLECPYCQEAGGVICTGEFMDEDS